VGTFEPGIVDENHQPMLNDFAFGPPDGTGCREGAFDVLVTGINGSVTFRFEPGYHIYDGPGADFITFQGRFAYGCVADGMVNELAHVEVSQDGVHFYYCADEAYDVNPDPSQSNDGYVYASVRNLHGNDPTWANPDHQMQAQHLVDGAWVELPGVAIPPDFTPHHPHLGGNRFDLSTYRSLQDDSPWPAAGQMRYLRIIDDDRILDGQDYDKRWSTGAQVQAALGIHTSVDPGP
jgi:hypothetical protein